MTMPSFVLIGAMRCGTTSLYHYLDEHSDIYMSPKKEPGFFAFEGETLRFRTSGGREAPISRTSVTDLATYRALFDGVKNEKAIGEASPFYLYVPKSAEGIRRHIPDAKLICILRNPVDRAYSSFLRNVRGGAETTDSFETALAEEDRRISENYGLLWHYTKAGFFAGQLRRFFDVFAGDRIQVHLYDDLVADAQGLIQSIYRFLDVDDSFVPNLNLRHNVSGVPTRQQTDSLVTRKSKLKSLAGMLVPSGAGRRFRHWLRDRNLEKPPLHDHIRQRLTALFRDDVLDLQELISRDLSAWLDAPTAVEPS